MFEIREVLFPYSYWRGFARDLTKGCRISRFDLSSCWDLHLFRIPNEGFFAPKFEMFKQMILTIFFHKSHGRDIEQLNVSCASEFKPNYY